MAALPALVGAQVGSYEVGRKNLLTRKGVAAMVRHGKNSAKALGKIGLPMLAGSALFHEGRYQIRKRNLQK